MDRICVAVLDKINSQASIGRYVVFSEDELSEAVPENGDFNGVKNVLKTLADGGYIDVKYSGGNLYCVAPLKNYAEDADGGNAEAEKKPPRTETRAAFIAAFAGGVLGSLIISLIFLFMGYAG